MAPEINPNISAINGYEASSCPGLLRRFRPLDERPLNRQHDAFALENCDVLLMQRMRGKLGPVHLVLG